MTALTRLWIAVSQRSPSLRKIAWITFSTERSVKTRVSAIAALFLPSAISRSTSRSRGVSSFSGDSSLRAAGFQTIEATTGRAGIALAIETTPQLILLDLELPDMRGADVALELRRQSQTARIPVVALSARRYVGDRERLAAAGFAGYLEKPIDVGKFPEQVRSY